MKISSLNKIASVRHVVNVSTLDLVALDEKSKDGRKNTNEQLQPASKRKRKSSSRDRSSSGKKPTTPSLLEDGDYPSLRIDTPSADSAETLKRDLYEDGYGQKFATQRMYFASRFRHFHCWYTLGALICVPHRFQYEPSFPFNDTSFCST